MNDFPNAKPAQAEPSRLLFWFRRPLAFVLAATVTLLALAWGVENWRGARAWSAEKRDLMARGEPLSMEQLVGPLPPDEENFAATPLLRGILDYSLTRATNTQSFWRDPEAQARLNAIKLPDPRVPPAQRLAETKRQGEAIDRRDERPLREGRIDLASYALGLHLSPRTCPPDLSPELAQRYGCEPARSRRTKPADERENAASIVDPAGEVLKYLQRFEPELQEIAEAVRRPGSQFTLHWSEGYQTLLPHLAPLKQFSILFSVRSAARLRKEDVEGAFADTLTCLRLAQTVKTEPLLISQLVHIAQHAIAVKSFWQGLVDHKWSAEQLATFQTELARFDFQKDLARAIQGERILQNGFFDHFGPNGRSSLESSAPSGEVDATSIVALCGWIPGWTRQNQVRLNRYDDLQLRQAGDPHWPANLVHAPNQSELAQSVGLAGNTPYAVLGRLLLPDLTKAQGKAARGCTVNRLAMVACALERFRLENGGYPKELAELSPRYLSAPLLDPMSAAPFRYERRSEPGAPDSTGFRLWSVGLNGQDDGGVTLERENDEQGDWVWPEPAPQRAPLLF